jgi:hypothetical protein
MEATSAVLALNTDRETRLWPAALAVACLAAALYCITLSGGLVYDDNAIAREDPRLHDPHLWWRYLTQGYWTISADRVWRPLVSLTFAVQAWSSSAVWPLHLVNVLLHALASALVAILGGRLAGKRVAWLSGLLFAAHPVHVEAVAAIVGRCELLCALGYLGAMLLFLRRPLTIRRALGITSCFLIALLSKEQGMLLPALLLAWGLLRPASGPMSAEEKVAARWLVVLLTWSLSAYLIYRQWILPFFMTESFFDWTFNPIFRATGIHRWLLPVAWLGRYLQLLVAPVWPSPDYGLAVLGSRASASDPDLYLGAMTLLAWGALFWISIRRRWVAASAALIGLPVSYAIVSNVFAKIGVSVAERLMYLPSVFFVILVGLALARLPRRAVIAVMTVLLLAASIRAVTYAACWHDARTLFSTTVRHYPESVRLQLFVSNEYLKAGELEQAQAAAARAVATAPEYDQAWHADGCMAMMRGDLDHATASAERAFDLQPNLNTMGLLAEIHRRRMEKQAASRPTTLP